MSLSVIVSSRRTCWKFVMKDWKCIVKKSLHNCKIFWKRRASTASVTCGQAPAGHVVPWRGCSWSPRRCRWPPWPSGRPCTTGRRLRRYNMCMHFRCFCIGTQNLTRAGKIFLSQYFSTYQQLSSVDMIRASSLPFPDVSVCVAGSYVWRETWNNIMSVDAEGEVKFLCTDWWCDNIILNSIYVT